MTYNPSTDSSDPRDRAEIYAESTSLQYGVVEDSIPEEEIYRHDENKITIYQFHDGGPYWLDVGSRIGKDTAIWFDKVRWEAGEHQGTLWFSRIVGDEEVTTGFLKWHAAFPTRELGKVGLWFLERIDLGEYRSDVECPKCGGTILRLPMSSACEEPDCELYAEGHVVEQTLGHEADR